MTILEEQSPKKLLPSRKESAKNTRNAIKSPNGSRKRQFALRSLPDIAAKLLRSPFELFLSSLILLAIGLITLVIPISFVWILWLVTTACNSGIALEWTWMATLATCWAFMEDTPRGKVTDIAQVHTALTRVFKYISDGNEFISGWAFDAPLDSLGLNHLHDWIAYSVYGRKIHHLGDKELQNVVELTSLIHGELELEVKGLGEEDVALMTHSVDKVHFIPRPLLMYVVLLL